MEKGNGHEKDSLLRMHPNIEGCNPLYMHDLILSRISNPKYFQNNATEINLTKFPVKMCKSARNK